jgi:hypothetical protein
MFAKAFLVLTLIGAVTVFFRLKKSGTSPEKGLLMANKLVDVSLHDRVNQAIFRQSLHELASISDDEYDVLSAKIVSKLSVEQSALVDEFLETTANWLDEEAIRLGNMMLPFLSVQNILNVAEVLRESDKPRQAAVDSDSWDSADSSYLGRYFIRSLVEEIVSSPNGEAILRDLIKQEQLAQGEPRKFEVSLSQSGAGVRLDPVVINHKGNGSSDTDQDVLIASPSI